MYHDILVPTDGSDGVEPAIKRALDLAAQYDATVHALYAVEAVPGMDHGAEQLVDALQEEGERSTKDVAEQARERGLTAETDIRVGAPHQAILDYADEHGVDLVVMGTHGRTGLDRMLLGSVAEKVVRLAPVPVLTVPYEQANED
jgi:nucleotide-binding universal stress UspA family protein